MILFFKFLSNKTDASGEFLPNTGIFSRKTHQTILSYLLTLSEVDLFIVCRIKYGSVWVHALQVILVIYRTKRLTLYLMMSHNVMYRLLSDMNLAKKISVLNTFVK